MKASLKIAAAAAALLSMSACTWGTHSQHYSYSSSALSQTDVMQIQQALAAEGFYHGNIDGAWGPQTTQAIREYQSAHGYVASGMLTESQLYNMNVRLHDQY